MIDGSEVRSEAQEHVRSHDRSLQAVQALLRNLQWDQLKAEVLPQGCLRCKARHIEIEMKKKKAKAEEEDVRWLQKFFYKFNSTRARLLSACV